MLSKSHVKLVVVVVAAVVLADNFSVSAAIVLRFATQIAYLKGL